MAVNRKPAPTVVAPCAPHIGRDRIERHPIEKTLNRPAQLCLFGGNGGDPLGIHGTGDLTDSVIIHRNHRDIAGPVEHLAKGLMSDERMVDRDNHHVVSVGSVEGRGDTGKWPMSMNGVWPSFPPVSIGAEKNGSVGNRPQCRANHFEHRLVANEDICLVLSHAGAHAAG